MCFQVVASPDIVLLFAFVAYLTGIVTATAEAQLLNLVFGLLVIFIITTLQLTNKLEAVSGQGVQRVVNNKTPFWYFPVKG